MPHRKVVKRTYKVARRTGAQQGMGIFGDIWKGIKNVAKLAKKHKVVSKGSNIWQMLGLPGAPIAKEVGQIASKAGYGRKKRRGKKPGPKKAHRKGHGLRVAGGSLKRAGGKRGGAGAGKRKTTRRRKTKKIFP